MNDERVTHDSSSDPHADKYNDPRVKITGRGIALGVGVILFSMVGAAASIYGRRTRLERSSEFWGAETILALQLGERIELLPKSGPDFSPVELTGTPGLGHLRRSLLDERSFDWDTENDKPVAEKSAAAEEPYCVTLRLTDPNGKRFEQVEIDLDLAQGWVGHSDAAQSVRIVQRKRSGLRNFLETIMTKETDRYDLRPN